MRWGLQQARRAATCTCVCGAVEGAGACERLLKKTWLLGSALIAFVYAAAAFRYSPCLKRALPSSLNAAPGVGASAMANVEFGPKMARKRASERNRLRGGPSGPPLRGARADPLWRLRQGGSSEFLHYFRPFRVRGCACDACKTEEFGERPARTTDRAPSSTCLRSHARCSCGRGGPAASNADRWTDSWRVREAPARCGCCVVVRHQHKPSARDKESNCAACHQHKSSSRDEESTKKEEEGREGSCSKGEETEGVEG